MEGNAGNPKLNDSRVPLLTAFDDCKDVEKDVDAYLASDTASNSSYTATESLLESMKDGHERSSSDSIDLAPLGVKYSLSREFSVDVQCSNDHKARYRLLGLNRVVALRICMVLLTVVIAIAVPQFELLISFVGSLGLCVVQCNEMNHLTCCRMYYCINGCMMLCDLDAVTSHIIHL